MASATSAANDLVDPVQQGRDRLATDGRIPAVFAPRVKGGVEKRATSVCAMGTPEGRGLRGKEEGVPRELRPRHP